MKTLVSSLVLVTLCTGCSNLADDCYNTLSCPPGPDGGPTVVYVVSDAGAPCNGVCVKDDGDSQGWSPVPFVFWQGDVTQEPKDTEKCPVLAPNPSTPWYSDPQQTPVSCAPCSCAPSTGTCAPPATVTVSASPVCPSDGDAGVPFDPPSGWDGGCTANDAIPAVDCDGGPACSATVAPTTPVDDCVPSQPMIDTIVNWSKIAFSCTGNTNQGACANPGDICVPAPPVTPGYSICVSREGDEPAIVCPAGYPDRSVLYVSATDNRHCAPCECGEPQGSSCSSLVTLYSDEACSADVASVTVTSDSMCVEIPAGVSLGSKQAGPSTYSPGTCQPSGGQPSGDVQPTVPFTFCCRK
jgi:hypothetical protein